MEDISSDCEAEKQNISDVSSEQLTGKRKSWTKTQSSSESKQKKQKSEDATTSCTYSKIDKKR